MSRPIYIFAGGGTGGHLVPALAVAEELTGIQPEARIVFACSARQIDRRILSSTPHAIVPQPVVPMPRGSRGWADFSFACLAGRRFAKTLVRDLRPEAVFGLGAFAAVPVTLAAARAGIRTALMSIDALPGRANRLLARRVNVVFAQFERTAEALAGSCRKAEVVGCPVRPAVLTGSAEEARVLFGLRPGRRTLLVMAGSLGAESINQAVAALAGDLDGLANEWQVLHLAGPGKAEQVAQAAAGGLHRKVVEFCERMDLAYAVADLALCRAGAATVGELAAAAAPAVLMPYPYHRDQHQRYNAAAMVSAGAAVLVDDAADPTANAELLRKSLVQIMRRPESLEAMQAAARGRARTDAAARIARWLAEK